MVPGPQAYNDTCGDYSGNTGNNNTCGSFNNIAVLPGVTSFKVPHQGYAPGVGEAAPKPCQSIPYGRNGRFTGREGLLAKVKSYKCSGHNRIALHGFCGSGKTQIALEYVRQCADDSSCHIFWVGGGGVPKFREGFRNIARLVRIPPCSAETADARLLEVKRWFEDRNNRNWILVIDNADSEADFAKDGPIAKFIPQAMNGTLIITTRSRQIASRQCSATIEVGEMTEEEALELFSKRYCGRGGLKDKEKEGVAAILSTVHRLPLIVVGLADFMTLAEVPPSMHQNTPQEKQIENLLLWDFSDIYRESEKENILGIYIAVFDQIRQQMPRALDILRLMAFFSHQSIPEELLTHSGLKGMDYSVDFPRAIGKLSGCWLVTMVDCGCGGKRFYDLNRLVRLSLEKYLPPDELNQGRRAALEVISRLFPQSPDEQQYISPAYIPHALAATEDSIDPTAEELSVRVKLYLEEQAVATTVTRQKSS